MNSRSHRRSHGLLALVLILAVAALAVSLTDQVRRDTAPVMVRHSGTPVRALTTGDPGNELPPDLALLTDSQESDFAIAAVARVQPAVITVVRAEQARSLGDRSGGDGGAVGSGVIVSQDGYALASLRTTGNGDRDLRVVFADGASSSAKVVAIDEALQVVMLKIENPPPAVAPLAIYDPLPGQRVLAIGSALDDYFSTVTGGVVSVLNATLPASGDYLPVRGIVQHDAAINQGNEGGPLVDLNGAVIAINVGSVARSDAGSVQGWSFAVPINQLGELLAAVS